CCCVPWWLLAGRCFRRSKRDAVAASCGTHGSYCRRLHFRRVTATGRMRRQRRAWALPDFGGASRTSNEGVLMNEQKRQQTQAQQGSRQQDSQREQQQGSVSSGQKSQSDRSQASRSDKDKGSRERQDSGRSPQRPS